jgi:polar amino acid transport system substrate-binding protein
MFKIIAAVFFAVMIVAVNSPAEETWKIASLNWEPYSGAEMTTQGNSIQKLRVLLRKEKINLIVEFFPWKRAQRIAEKKEYVGYFPAWPEEVNEGFTASPAVDWSELGIMKHSECSVRFESIDDLFRKYRVGIVQTYAYPKVIADAVKKYPNHAEKAPNEISLLKKLAMGRHPAAITDPTVMMYLAERNGIYNVEIVNVVMKKELVVAFRDDEDNRNRINRFRNLLKGM